MLLVVLLDRGLDDLDDPLLLVNRVPLVLLARAFDETSLVGVSSPTSSERWSVVSVLVLSLGGHLAWVLIFVVRRWQLTEVTASSLLVGKVDVAVEDMRPVLWLRWIP